MTPLEQAWNKHKDAAAEAAHIAWMQTKISHGFADHPWQGQRADGGPGPCLTCPFSRFRHHTDMIPFAELSDEIKAYDYETAYVGFKVGWEAGRERIEELEGEVEDLKMEFLNLNERL